MRTSADLNKTPHAKQEPATNKSNGLKLRENPPKQRSDVRCYFPLQEKQKKTDYSNLLCIWWQIGCHSSAKNFNPFDAKTQPDNKNTL